MILVINFGKTMESKSRVFIHDMELRADHTSWMLLALLYAVTHRAPQRMSEEMPSA
jgi:hypothetical protein